MLVDGFICFQGIRVVFRHSPTVGLIEIFTFDVLRHGDLSARDGFVNVILFNVIFMSRIADLCLFF